jgi:hypothetical protein
MGLLRNDRDEGSALTLKLLKHSSLGGVVAVYRVQHWQDASGTQSLGRQCHPPRGLGDYLKPQLQII